MSNKKRNFIGQIASRESRTRYYAMLSEELTKASAPSTTPRAVDDNDAPSNPTKHYHIPKTTSVSHHLEAFVTEHQDDRALHVSC